LSAPYRISPSPLENQADISRLSQMFYEANPDRLLWGTDWPHTNREQGVPALEVSRYRDIAPAMLVQALQPWSEIPDVLERILVVNPQRLYG
jgi:predicted TIM-barrel fold metal-dependent hydrolase